jgi:hypothetical protein
LLYIIPYNKLTKERKMPDISKFKSVSVSMDTHDKLMSLAQNRFEVPVSVQQKVIEFLLEKEIKKRNGRSNGKRRS